ncbi:hypothetical protein FBY51_1841 [Zymomonas mobilis]|uniref:hypothetical protein n=1 Tax=Zymomonas mobilis TaxID=542 RepID=UPI00026D8202|nr:hypothetical protein [Zymomonas mobilis]AFN57591.1 hypothetical protein ZZ6_1740 [Zymomonas mobilis subsp. mobilis ATCC 29191]TQK74379.1 hypothetical protein FBY53_1863 [Zymomonas mobilis]TQL14614.1 hypothetical protein FBY51_1841 [Zymomonas mobilis]GEB88318.1 hypothetical protein ZMO01_16580 [Zymomonas mobilis subsp. mobilis]
MTQTSISKIDEIRTWIRNERKRINWTAAKLADEAKQVAARHGVKLNLQQQSISLFENGKIKSIPLWLNYVKAALLEQAKLADFVVSKPSFTKEEEKLKFSIDTTSEDDEKKIIYKEILPSEDKLKNLFLSLLVPLDVDFSDSWSLKQNIASSLAKKFPVALSHPLLYNE